MNSDSTLILDEHADSLVVEGLSIALIGPDEERRKAASNVLSKCQSGRIREFSTYPPSLSDVPKLLEQHYDVIVIDLDSRPEYALELVENVCAHGTATVMVYSVKADSDQLVRCMRAGAREFLTLPFVENVVNEALVRAATRRPSTSPSQKKAGGRLMVFLGAKGGDGVTTLACNFAVSMAKESGQSTLLIDLDLPLGDAALNLGVVAEYSTINALQNAARLDSAFLSKLLVKHSSGVYVLAAPGKFPQFDASHDAIDKLISVARQDFDNVVIDMGSRLDLMSTSLFKDGSTVYLVIQAGIAGLRNSNRLISQYFATGVPKLEIVLNRFQSRTLGVAEDQIAKALTRPAQWKIPNDYAAVRRMQHTAVPLALEDSPISRLIRKMARAACGLPPIPEKGFAEKTSGFSLKNLGRSFTSKISSSEEPPQVSVPEAAPVAEKVAAPTSVAPVAVAPADAPASHTVDASPVTTTASQTVVEDQPHSSPAESTEAVSTKVDDSPQTIAPAPPAEPETRSYRGATYVKGADGKWYLQKAQIGAENAAVEEAKKPQTPVIVWAAPAPILYGSKLSAAQLNATSSVPGSFVYAPAEGEILAAGEHTLTVTFTPEDTKAYTAAEATVALTVTKAVPTITWAAPATITYGVALDGSQLNATASVPGEFVYTPAAGEVLAAGEHTLSVSFTPIDAVSYESATATAQIIVNKAVVAITWAAPNPITYGAALDSSQLNATAPVPGEFVYAPAAREVLAAGDHTLSVSFTPVDTVSYEPASATVQIDVAKAAPAITWETPVAIAFGAALGDSQLNAAASVTGDFVYTPAAGEVLPTGIHTLSVSFKPLDVSNYLVAEASVPLTVAKATPIVLWAVPEAIAENIALGADQLNATALVEGSFEYSPGAGVLLPAGTHTLSVTFNPKAAEEYNTVQSSVLLTVTEAVPEIEAPTPAEESIDPITSPLEAASEPSSVAEEEPDVSSVELNEPSEAATAETDDGIEVVPDVESAIEPVTEMLAEPVIEAVEVSLPEAPAETAVEAETASPDESLSTQVEEPVFESMVETVESTPEEEATETPIESDAGSMADLINEPEIEQVSDTAVEDVEPVCEQVASVSDENSVAEADAALDAEVSAEPVAEQDELPTVAAPVEVPAIPVAESNVAPLEAGHELPEQALVKIPPPKFTFEAGSGLNLMGTAVFPDGTTIYLVMQPGSGGHVDSQKLVSQFLSGGELKPEIVINRYEPRPQDEENEQAEAEFDQARDLPVAPQMDAAVRPASVPEKKRSFLKGLRQSLWAKVTASEKLETFTQLGLKQRPEAEAPAPFAATAEVRVHSGFVASAAPIAAEEAKTPTRVAATEDLRPVEAYRAPEPEVETRTYQGATYVKGSDGKWHLQQQPSRAVQREVTPAVAPAPVVAPAAEPEEDRSAWTAAELRPEEQSAPAEAASMPNEQAAAFANPTLSVEVPAAIEPLAIEPQAIDAEAPALSAEDQVPVGVVLPSNSVETAVSLSAVPPETEVEVDEQREVVEVASEPPSENAVPAPVEEGLSLQAEEPATALVPEVKPPARGAAKAKSAVKPKATAPVKPTNKAKKAAKTQPKPAAKAKKVVKAPAKTTAKGKKPIKGQAKPAPKAIAKSKKNGKAPVKATAKSKKAVKAPVKAIAKASKSVRSLPKKAVKVAAKAKKPVRAGSKAQVKTATKKAVKASAKPVAKKKAAKIPVRKPAHKR
ncbi:MAG: AAA family ATPase [Terracidiphilus sp.]